MFPNSNAATGTVMPEVGFTFSFLSILGITNVFYFAWLIIATTVFCFCWNEYRSECCLCSSSLWVVVLNCKFVEFPVILYDSFFVVTYLLKISWELNNKFKHFILGLLGIVGTFTRRISQPNPSTTASSSGATLFFHKSMYTSVPMSHFCTIF